MRIGKKIAALLLAVVLVMISGVSAFAAPAAKETTELTLEERINGLTLTPKKLSELENIPDSTWYDMSRIEKIRDNAKLTNYEKLEAAFKDIAAQTKGLSCTSHASVLGTAYQMLGFQVYGASGGVKTKDGKTPEQSSGMMGFTKPGYTAHSWIAIEIDGKTEFVVTKQTGTIDGKPFETEVRKIKGTDISVLDDFELDGEIVFFDVNLHSTHGNDFDKCFAVFPKDTTWYTAIGVGDFLGM